MGDYFGSRRQITCDVPQRSVLGRALFLMYVNSIFKLELYGGIKLFADDTIIVYLSKSVDYIKFILSGYALNCFVGD